MKHQDLLDQVVSEQPYPQLFVTISGAHLYGFESADSDFDIRACHILPARELLGLKKGPETIDATTFRDGVELDFVSHDAEKFFGMMLKKNGYVLEQLFSPLVLSGGDQHERLKEIAKGCITKNHAHHYLGFAAGQWKLFHQGDPPRVKPLLYTYRVLLTGIHLMRTGKIEANLEILNEEFRLPYIKDLMQEKREGAEKCAVKDLDLAFHLAEYERLSGVLEEEQTQSQLPDSPSAHDALHEFLVEIRTGNKS